jgi:hypothetical protein
MIWTLHSSTDSQSIGADEMRPSQSRPSEEENTKEEKAETNPNTQIDSKKIEEVNSNVTALTEDVKVLNKNIKDVKKKIKGNQLDHYTQFKNGSIVLGAFATFVYIVTKFPVFSMRIPESLKKSQLFQGMIAMFFLNFVSSTAQSFVGVLTQVTKEKEQRQEQKIISQFTK